MKIERGMTTYQLEKLGLGLSLVHHLVSANGSDLRYEIVADETMTKFCPWSSSTGSSCIRSLLCMHLRKLDYTSHRAENGEVAIEMLRSAPDPSMYNLVLMDLRMPVMDGFEAAKIIRGSIANNIPIVALTGETSEEHRMQCEEIGFDAFETKPLKRPQLMELLNKLVPGYQAPP